MKDLIEKLEKAATDCLHGDPWYTEDDLVSAQNVSLPQDRALIAAANPQAILALLSYTKQCREKMDLALRHLDEGFSPSGGMYSGGSVELVAARQALSTQPGERE